MCAGLLRRACRSATARRAAAGSFFPRLMLTNAQQPSPIMTAMASATTVRGKTTVVAALP